MCHPPLPMCVLRILRRNYNVAVAAENSVQLTYAQEQLRRAIPFRLILFSCQRSSDEPEIHRF
jgi:hypothetical protein